MKDSRFDRTSVGKAANPATGVNLATGLVLRLARPETCRQVRDGLLCGAEILPCPQEAFPDFGQLCLNVSVVGRIFGPVSYVGTARWPDLHKTFCGEQAHGDLGSVDCYAVVRHEAPVRRQGGARGVGARLDVGPEQVRKLPTGKAFAVLIHHSPSLPNCLKTGVDIPESNTYRPKTVVIVLGRFIEGRTQ
jgi:hypothetical protein